MPIRHRGRIDSDFLTWLAGWPRSHISNDFHVILEPDEVN
jgi:hypothetical protein